MNNQAPLAERVRPQTLDDLAGQEHLVGRGGILRTAIENKKLPSIILWGPPGTGKTTIANIIAQSLNLPFFTLSAISAGVKEVRDAISQAQGMSGAVLFIDEIHRFNKGQQDALLGAVEKGIITLIGATTENPSFEVNSALLSRCQVYILKSLGDEDLIGLLHAAIEKDEWLTSKDIRLEETEALLTLAGGDARKLLNLFELVVASLSSSNTKEGPVSGEDIAPSLNDKDQAEEEVVDHKGNEPVSQPRSSKNTVTILNEMVLQVAQQRVALYDKKGDQHYYVISAFIKSMRGSDPNGAIYWLARMIEGGEDVKFIARRMVIFASEDIGNANANALLLANATFDAVNKIGYPESRIILAQCATYLASSHKSNASYTAIDEALEVVRKEGDLPVPLHIRNAHTSLMKKLDYGKGYKYAHSYEGNFTEQEFLPDRIKGRAFYQPGHTPREEELRKFLKVRWKEKYGY